MNNIQCQIPNHQESKFTQVCLNKDCQDKRLCCYICLGEIHKCHIEKTMEIEQINDFIQKQSTDQFKFPQSYCYGQLYRESQYFTIEKPVLYHSLNQFQYTLQIIKSLEFMIDLTHSLLKVIKEKLELVKQQNLNEFLTQQSNIQQGIEYWNILIEDLIKYFQIDNQLIIPKQQNQGQTSENQSKVLDKKKRLQFSTKPIELEGHQDEVIQVAISQDGSLIVSGSKDKTVKLWEGKTKKLQYTIVHDSSVYRVTISSKNEYLAFSDLNDSIKLFDLKSNKVLWTQKEHTDYIRCIIFSQDTQYLLSGGYDKKLIIWSVINNTKIYCFQTDSAIESIVMSGDNKLTSCICRSSNIYIWDFQTKTKSIREKHTHLIGYGLCKSADSMLYISCGSDGLIKIWKLNKFQRNQKLIRSIKAACKGIGKVLLTSDDLYIISISNEEGQITIHEMETGKLIQQLESGCEFISISNDVNTLVSSNSYDKTFRIWMRE